MDLAVRILITTVIVAGAFSLVALGLNAVWLFLALLTMCLAALCGALLVLIWEQP